MGDTANVKNLPLRVVLTTTHIKGEEHFFPTSRGTRTHSVFFFSLFLSLFLSLSISLTHRHKVLSVYINAKLVQITASKASPSAVTINTAQLHKHTEMISEFQLSIASVQRPVSFSHKFVLMQRVLQ